MGTNTNLDAIAGVVEQQMDEWSVPGIVVGILRDGDVDTRAWGTASLNTGEPLRADALFRVASISKVFTATLAMTAVDEGKLDLDKPVIEYLPELRLGDAGAQATITTRQLLSHQSGLLGDIVLDKGLGADALKDAIATFESVRQLTRPGEAWHYCNSGFHLAGRVVEQVLGMPFDQAMDERVFTPLGMERTCFFAHDAIVWPNALGHNPKTPGSSEHVPAPQYYPRNRLPAGGVFTNAEELLRFAKFHLGDGTFDDKRVMGAETLAAMQERQCKAACFADEWGIGWQITWWGETKVIGHGGSTSGFQTMLVLVPDQQFATVILTNSARGSAAVRRIEPAILELFCGLREAEHPQYKLSAEQLAHFAGRYQPTDGAVDVAVTGNGLSLQLLLPEEEVLKPVMTVAMRPISEREFVAVGGEVDGSRADFLLNDDGSVRFLRFGGRLADRVVDAT